MGKRHHFSTLLCHTPCPFRGYCGSMVYPSCPRIPSCLASVVSSGCYFPCTTASDTDTIIRLAFIVWSPHKTTHRNNAKAPRTESTSQPAYGRNRFNLFPSNNSTIVPNGILDYNKPAYGSSQAQFPFTLIKTYPYNKLNMECTRLYD